MEMDMYRLSLRTACSIVAGGMFYALAIGFPVLAAEVQQIIMGVRPVPNRDCTPETATEIEFQRLVESLNEFDNQCILTHALMLDAMRLYSDMDGYYRVEGTGDERLEHHRIGLYTWDEDDERLRTMPVADAVVTGVLGHCEFLLQVGNPGGYCHGPGVAYIAASHVEAMPTAFVRLVGEEARSRVGNLVFAPDDWSLRETIEPMVLRWFRAVQRGAIRVHGDGNNMEESVFVSFIGTTHTPEFVYFILNPPDVSDWSTWEAVACTCKRPDCTGLWPIAVADASNATVRPYVCATIWRRLPTQQSSGGYNIEALVDDRELREPSVP